MWKDKKRYFYLNHEETHVVLQSLIRLKKLYSQRRENVVR